MHHFSSMRFRNHATLITTTVTTSHWRFDHGDSGNSLVGNFLRRRVRK
jgi:hypothetical protein